MPTTWPILTSLIVFAAVFMSAMYGYPWARVVLARTEAWYEKVLVRQLLIDIQPRLAVVLAGLCVLATGLAGYLALESGLWFLIGCVAGAFIPNLVVRHLEQQRRRKLDAQIVDGITTLASGVRAGLNLVQSMELLVKNAPDPIRQEFAQLLREYNLGMDLNQAMRGAANRIGSSYYRLLFTAIEMHRVRGGDAGESLDRIAQSVREIIRLEGKIDAVTAQGRTQANMMAAMTFVILMMLYGINPQGVDQMFIEPVGRGLLLTAALLIAGGFWWIRKIMQVEV